MKPESQRGNSQRFLLHVADEVDQRQLGMANRWALSDALGSYYPSQALSSKAKLRLSAFSTWKSDIISDSCNCKFSWFCFSIHLQAPSVGSSSHLFQGKIDHHQKVHYADDTSSNGPRPSFSLLIYFSDFDELLFTEWRYRSRCIQMQQRDFWPFIMLRNWEYMLE